MQLPRGPRHHALYHHGRRLSCRLLRDREQQLTLVRALPETTKGLPSWHGGATGRQRWRPRTARGPPRIFRHAHMSCWCACRAGRGASRAVALGGQLAGRSLRGIVGGGTASQGLCLAKPPSYPVHRQGEAGDETHAPVLVLVSSVWKRGPGRTLAWGPGRYPRHTTPSRPHTSITAYARAHPYWRHPATGQLWTAALKSPLAPQPARRRRLTLRLDPAAGS
jgi:hypothetical protein